jgi:Uncharacterised nucleotidyltransferase
MSSPIQLSLHEANELLSAWAWRRAEEHGIRLLLIKGRALSDYGLRPARVSADVDVLVEPARFDEYCTLIADAGWHEFPGSFSSEAFTLHSRSFRRDGWPNSFDVHGYYPGFLRDPADVFEALWEERGELSFAQHTCPVPSRAASLLVMALHSLRGTETDARHRDELAALRALTLPTAERDELAATALATGATAPLRDLLPELGVAVTVAAADLRTPAFLEWHRKTVDARGYAVSWFLLLRRAPWRSKPRIVRRALWPSRHDFAIDHPETPAGFWPAFRGRVRRLGRGLRRTPAAIAAMRRR